MSSSQLIAEPASPEARPEPGEYDLAEMAPQTDHLVTEDDTPVDNIFSEKQQRLLTEPLYTSWHGPAPGRSFLAAANVGIFYAIQQPPVVPDVFLSVDVQAWPEWWEKRGRSYLVWEHGKPPDVVIEVVSNLKGEESGQKLRDYAWMRVPYYVIFDPQQLLQPTPLRLYELREGEYVERGEHWLTIVQLGLVLWEGSHEGVSAQWLRWCDAEGLVIPTGAEGMEKERQRAEQERQRAEQEHQRAEQERQRAERLLAKLRDLGVEPEA